MVAYLSIGKNSDDTFPLSRLPFPRFFDDGVPPEVSAIHD